MPYSAQHAASTRLMLQILKDMQPKQTHRILYVQESFVLFRICANVQTDSLKWFSE